MFACLHDVRPRRSRSTLVATVVVAGLVAISHGLIGATQQTDASRAGSAGRPEGVSVQRSPEGDLLVTYKGSGALKTITIEPATKTMPVVRSSIQQVEKGFRYSYELVNGPRAKQALNGCTFDVRGLERGTIATPQGWKVIAVDVAPRMTWFKDAENQELVGIAPGGSVGGFSFVSPLLPGPVEARCSAAVWPPSFPADMDPPTIEYLRRTVLQRNTVLAWTLAPIVVSGANEPELTAEVMLARILGSYERAVAMSHHPAKTEILANLREANRLAATDSRSAGMALDLVRSFALDGATDEWSTNLGHGLWLCLEAVRVRFGL